MAVYYKWIGKTLFRRGTFHTKKSVAKEAAETSRKKGYPARVIKGADGWTVWVAA